MPGDAGVARQAVAEDVWPGADDLEIDALRIEPGMAFRHRLDEPREERPHLETVREAQRGRRSRCLLQRDADVLATRGDGGEELWRHVMGMDVDGHGAPLAEVSGRKYAHPTIWSIVCTQTIPGKRGFCAPLRPILRANAASARPGE